MNIETLLTNINPSIIKTSKEVMTEAKERILKIQRGVEQPIKTRYQHLNDNLLGGLGCGSSILTICAGTGIGKTKTLQIIETSIFDKKLNPNCDNYVLLKLNFEMSSLNLALRQLNDYMKKPMKDILFTKFDGEDLHKFNHVFEKETNPNIFYIEKPLTSDEFYVNVRQFIINHKDKEKIVISVDHLGLMKEKGNEGLKKTIDDTLNYQNELKKEFSNVCFINLSQLNRDLESRISSPKDMFPKLSDVYNSSSIGFISDVVVILNYPKRYGIEKYGIFSPTKYPHLTDFMIDPNRTTTAFEVDGNLFFHYVKVRQQELSTKVDNSLHIERLYKVEPKEKSVYGFPSNNIDLKDKLPVMDNTMDLWDDVSSSEDDEMPF